MPSTPAPARRPVSVTVNGRLYRGTYVVVGSTITVSALGQSETTQIGRMPVEDLAGSSSPGSSTYGPRCQSEASGRLWWRSASRARLG